MKKIALIALSFLFLTANSQLNLKEKESFFRSALALSPNLVPLGYEFGEDKTHLFALKSSGMKFEYYLYTINAANEIDSKVEVKFKEPIYMKNKVKKYFYTYQGLHVIDGQVYFIHRKRLKKEDAYTIVAVPFDLKKKKEIYENEVVVATGFGDDALEKLESTISLTPGRNRANSSVNNKYLVFSELTKDYSLTLKVYDQSLKLINTIKSDELKTVGEDAAYNFAVENNGEVKLNVAYIKDNHYYSKLFYSKKDQLVLAGTDKLKSIPDYKKTRFDQNSVLFIYNAEKDMHKAVSAISTQGLFTANVAFLEDGVYNSYELSPYENDKMSINKRLTSVISTGDKDYLVFANRNAMMKPVLGGAVGATSTTYDIDDVKLYVRNGTEVTTKTFEISSKSSNEIAGAPRIIRVKGEDYLIYADGPTGAWFQKAVKLGENANETSAEKEVALEGENLKLSKTNYLFHCMSEDYNKSIYICKFFGKVLLVDFE